MAFCDFFFPFFFLRLSSLQVDVIFCEVPVGRERNVLYVRDKRLLSRADTLNPFNRIAE